MSCSQGRCSFASERNLLQRSDCPETLVRKEEAASPIGITPHAHKQGQCTFAVCGSISGLTVFFLEDRPNRCCSLFSLRCPDTASGKQDAAMA